uniref:Uncharacterized protein n=1 Tax=Hucho hucho TaxID=62062 RepID=A0A4W5PKI5_9TELE
MNTHKPAHKAKARHLCFLLLMCFPLAWGGVPGPCRHSVTKGHLLNLNCLVRTPQITLNHAAISTDSTN